MLTGPWFEFITLEDAKLSLDDEKTWWIAYNHPIHWILIGICIFVAQNWINKSIFGKVPAYDVGYDYQIDNWA